MHIGSNTINTKTATLTLLALLVTVGVSGCEDQSEPRTTHRSLADAASQLRSSAMIDSTPRGHVLWNGMAQILDAAECGLGSGVYVLEARGGGVVLRVVYAAQGVTDARAIDFRHPLKVELQRDPGSSEPLLFRAEQPSPEEAQITSRRDFSRGAIRLASANAEAARQYQDGARVEFEFRCS